MDLDKEFVASVIRGGREAYLDAMSRGLNPGVHLNGDGKVAWEYITEHWKSYSEVPSGPVVQAKVECDLTHSSHENYRFFLDELLNRRTFQICQEAAKGITEKLEARRPRDAAELLNEIQRKIRNERLGTKTVESLLALGSDVQKMYLEAKAGKRGIPTPWATMDEDTMGWFPEDLIMFVGRLGVGKTWVLILTAHAAWQANRKVLIITTEMNKVKMAMRFFALHFRLPFHEVRHGRLGEFLEQKFFKGIEEMLDGKGLSIVSGGMKFNMESVESAVELDEPNVLALDGPWLIKNSGRDKREIVANTFDDMKRVNQHYKIVTITNLQFNRSAKTGQDSTIAAENIGITDQAGWNADAVYGLVQNDEMKARAEMGLKNIKMREGVGGDLRVKWDFSSMDFSEIRPDAGPQGSPASLPDVGEDTFEDVPF